jgi:hypothetical protein
MMRALLAIICLVASACGGGAATEASGGDTTPVTLAPTTSTDFDPGSTTTPEAATTTGATTGETTGETTVETTTTSGPAETPVISFESRTLTFVRELRVPLWAIAEPDVAVSYRLVEGHPDSVGQENCAIDGSDLLFLTEPDPPPAPARCAVEASASGAEPVVAVIEIGFANWVVSIDPIGTVSHADTGGTIEVTVFEDSGSAYGISYEWFCSGGGFDFGTASPDPSSPGTTDYRFTIDVGPDAGICSITVQAEPLDHAGGGGRLETSFEVTP